MTPLQDGRSDALSRMAGSSKALRRAARSRSARATVPKDSAVRDVDGVDQDPVEALAKAGRADQRPPTSGSRGRGSGQQDRIKAAAVPVLSLIGVLLLIPAVWAVLLLAGAPVWHHERHSARGMAAVMLVCGPIAFAMFGGAAYYGAKLRGNRRDR